MRCATPQGGSSRCRAPGWPPLAAPTQAVTGTETEVTKKLLRLWCQQAGLRPFLKARSPLGNSCPAAARVSTRLGSPDSSCILLHGWGSQVTGGGANPNALSVPAASRIKPISRCWMLFVTLKTFIQRTLFVSCTDTRGSTSSHRCEATQPGQLRPLTATGMSREGGLLRQIQVCDELPSPPTRREGQRQLS